VFRDIKIKSLYRKNRRDIKINEKLEKDVKEIIDEIEIPFCRKVDPFKETDQM